MYIHDKDGESKMIHNFANNAKKKNRGKEDFFSHVDEIRLSTIFLHVVYSCSFF